MRITLKSGSEEGGERFKRALTESVKGLAEVGNNTPTRSIILLDVDPETEEADIRMVRGKDLAINLEG